MQVWGLTARGPTRLTGEPGQIVSRSLFRSEAAADGYKEVFRSACCNSPAGSTRSLSDLEDSEHLKIMVHEFVLAD